MLFGAVNQVGGAFNELVTSNDTSKADAICSASFPAHTSCTCTYVVAIAGCEGAKSLRPRRFDSLPCGIDR